MKYLEVTFRTQPCNETVTDVLSALCGDIGFESFMEAENGIKGYIQEALYKEEALKQMLENFPMENTEISFTRTTNGGEGSTSPPFYLTRMAF